MKKKQKGEQHKSMGGRSVNEMYISRSKVKAFANRLEGKKKMISPHKAELFWCPYVGLRHP